MKINGYVARKILLLISSTDKGVRILTFSVTKSHTRPTNQMKALESAAVKDDRLVKV